MDSADKAAKVRIQKIKQEEQHDLPVADCSQHKKQDECGGANYMLVGCDIQIEPSILRRQKRDVVLALPALQVQDNNGKQKQHQQQQPDGRVPVAKLDAINIDTGENILSKLWLFCQENRRSFCIVSGAGVLSSIILRQEEIGKSVAYEGRFEILTFAGSYMLAEDGALFSWTSRLTVSFALSDGDVVGGVVDGPLIASSPVDVVVASFIEQV